MPAEEAPEGRTGRQLLPILFWTGLGLAPVAALLIMLARGDGALRIAAVLAVLAVVLIGFSVTLRRAPDVNVDVPADRMADDLDTLRRDLRADVAAAAGANHRASGERLARLHDEVEALRRQVEALRADQGWGVAPGPGRQSASGARPATPPVAGPMPEPGTGPIGGRASVPMGGAAGMTRGIVRHTETVQVTTRQTIVDPHGADDDDPGYGYAAGPAAPLGRTGGWSAPDSPQVVPAPPAGRRREAEQPHGPAGGDRPRVLEPRLPDARSFGPRAGGPAELESAERAAGEDGQWSQLRATDRWTSMRSDDRGTELRMGERRAAVRADETGAHLHLEDRWATVRRDEPRGGGRRRADPADGAGTGARPPDHRGLDESSWRDEPRRAEPARRDEPYRDEPHRAEPGRRRAAEPDRPDEVARSWRAEDGRDPDRDFRDVPGRSAAPAPRAEPDRGTQRSWRDEMVRGPEPGLRDGPGRGTARPDEDAGEPPRRGRRRRDDEDDHHSGPDQSTWRPSDRWR